MHPIVEVDASNLYKIMCCLQQWCLSFRIILYYFYFSIVLTITWKVTLFIVAWKCNHNRQFLTILLLNGVFNVEFVGQQIHWKWTLNHTLLHSSMKKDILYYWMNLYWNLPIFWEYLLNGYWKRMKQLIAGNDINTEFLE